MPSPHLKDTKPLSKLKSIVLDPEPRQAISDLEDDDVFVGGIEEVDIPPYRPPTNAPPVTATARRPPVTAPQQAPQVDPSELADLMASLVAGDTVTVEEYAGGAIWVVIGSLLKKGFVATMGYDGSVYNISVRR